ncbi:MAG: LytTR family DNA-binding domain-containing protein [Gordonibacter sp.]|nr:LytTR family DNA-binding domain-containing protein [Gordonibacter sp.]
MLKIALCDDCPEDVALLRSALDSYLSRSSQDTAQVYPFDNALLCAEGLAQIGGVDVLLLDICMPGLLGTDIAREVRQRKDKTEIVFLTSSDEFAVEAFALKAAHYLVKPFSQDEFDEALETALNRIASKEIKRITLKARGRSIVSLDAEEITYIESSSHSQHLHTSTG